MARKSQRVAASSATTTRHKRVASNSTPLSAEPKSSKKQKATPTKSQYFKRSGKHVETAEDENLDSDESSEPEGEVSAFESEGEDVSSDGGDDEYDSEAKEKPRSGKKAKATSTPKTSAAIRTKENELLRPGVKAGLGPGTEVVIKKPKARSAGRIPYRAEIIHPNTLLFLEDLKANNDRLWLKMHDADFRQSERDWHGMVTALTEKLVEIDDTIPELPVKDVVFRIYRDIRFSPDKTPYSRKGPYAAYYVQVAPNGGSFVGGGLWHPDAAPVAAMRNDIDTRPRAIKEVLMNSRLQMEFLGGETKSEATAVKAFVSSNSENALKTKPKGYDAEHPDINLLRLRNYTIGRKLADSEVVGTNGFTRISDLLLCMKPFITYLNAVVMPDEEPEAEEDDEDDDEE